MAFLALISASIWRRSEGTRTERRRTDGADCGTDLAGVLPVHGVDGGARVHVHEVVMMVASHHSSTSVMELHG